MKLSFWLFIAVTALLTPRFGFSDEECRHRLEMLFSKDHKNRIQKIDEEIAQLKAESQRLEQRGFLYSPDEETQIRKKSKQQKLTTAELVDFRRNDIRLRLFLLEKEKWTYWTELLLSQMVLFSYPVDDAKEELVRVQLVTSKPLDSELAWKVLLYRYLERHLYLTNAPSSEMRTAIQKTFSLTDEEIVEALGPSSDVNYAVEKCLDELKKSFSHREMNAIQYQISPDYFPEKRSCCKTSCYNCPWNYPLKQINKTRN